MLYLHLTLASLKMIVRNRQALFWALVFPFIFVVIFALLGSLGDTETTIGVIDHANDSLSMQLVGNLQAVEGFEVDLRDDEPGARQEVRDGDLSYLLIIPTGLESQVNAGAPISIALVYDERQFGGSAIIAVERILDHMNLALAGASQTLTLNSEGILSEDVGFGAFVLPGIVLWGIMSSSIIGMAVALANYREKKLLRRIRVSPLRPRTFFAAQVSAYLMLSLVQAATILGLGSVVMRVSISGNLFTIGLLILISNIVFLNLGFIVGAFSKTGAAASGMGNVIVLPLVMFSGVFFTIETLPAVVTNVVRFLPLTPMVEILRGITLSDKPFMDFPLEFGIIAVWLVLTSVASVKIFKFE